MVVCRTLFGCRKRRQKFFLLSFRIFVEPELPCSFNHRRPPSLHYHNEGIWCCFRCSRHRCSWARYVHFPLSCFVVCLLMCLLRYRPHHPPFVCLFASALPPSLPHLLEGAIISPRSRNSVDYLVGVNTPKDWPSNGDCTNITGDACYNGQADFW